MSAPPVPARDPSRHGVPIATGLLSLALLVGVTVAHAADPVSVRGFPAATEPTWWLAGGTLVLQAAVLGARRRAPRAVLVAVAAGVPVLAVTGEAVGLGTLAVLVAAYGAALVALDARARAAYVVAGALVAAGVWAGHARAGGSGAADVLGALGQAAGTMGLPLLVAVVVSARRETRAARADSASALAREHDALVQAAVARERTAMARELHDIAAHHLSGIAVMTGAVVRQIDVDPEGAKRSVQQVRDQTTGMLRDLRNLVTLLRDDDAGAQQAVRMETLAGIADLVAAARRAGQDVTLETLGPVTDVVSSGVVGPLAQLAAYRAVQESLANAARHAPGAACRVLLDARTPERLEISVRNAPALPLPGPGPVGPDRGGYGLVGMRERAELTGASLDHGPTAEGGWEVRLGLPVTGPDVDSSTGSAS